MKENGTERRHTAIHEAGHTVARVRFDLLIGTTSIEAKPLENNLGRADGEESWGTTDAAEIEIMVSCAGYAASVASGLDENTAAMGCAQDFEEATEIIEFWKLGTLDDWCKRTVEFMSKTENIKAVAVLADKLMEFGTIPPDHAGVLIELADGECTIEEWEQFLSLWPFSATRAESITAA